MKQRTPIESMILCVRDQRVILAADLADLYGVPTKVLNQAVKRNIDRFPTDFAFQLTADEFSELKSEGTVSADGRAILRSQIVTLESGIKSNVKATPRWGKYAKFPPQAFTEHGAIMAANVINSPSAVAMGVYVVRAFVQMREQFISNAAVLKRLAEIDKTLLQHDQALHGVWQQLRPLLQPPPVSPRRKIGFDRGEKE